MMGCKAFCWVSGRNAQSVSPAGAWIVPCWPRAPRHLGALHPAQSNRGGASYHQTFLPTSRAFLKELTASNMSGKDILIPSERPAALLTRAAVPTPMALYSQPVTPCCAFLGAAPMGLPREASSHAPGCRSSQPAPGSQSGGLGPAWWVPEGGSAPPAGAAYQLACTRAACLGMSGSRVFPAAAAPTPGVPASTAMQGAIPNPQHSLAANTPTASLPLSGIPPSAPCTRAVRRVKTATP